MPNTWNLIKIEFSYVRFRILAFWGIYFILGSLIGLVWFNSLPSQENSIKSFLKFELIASALNSFLETPPYLVLSTFCTSLIGPLIILLVIDMIPTEVATGQLLVMKTSGTKLRRIYNTRILLITFGFLLSHLLIWAFIHIFSVVRLVNGSVIFYDAFFLSFLQFVFFSFVFLLFLAFCLLLAFILSTILENQVASSFLAIFTFLVPEIVQSFLYYQEIELTLSISAIFNNLYYSVPSPDGKVELLSASNSYVFIGLIALLIIVFGLILVFNWVIQKKEVY